MPNSLPIGSGISRATMVMATGTGWPARSERTMMSMPSGNWAPNFFCRRLRRNRSTSSGSTKPQNNAAPMACFMLPSNVKTPAKAAIMPMAMNSISRPKPIDRPDCSTSWLRLISGNRYSPPLVRPRSRRNCTSALSRSGLSSSTLSRRLMFLRYDALL